MYLDYWNLQKAPFDNVPDPSMYADCHESMEKVISETIFAIKEADEDFAVITGAVGSGKTLALRVITEALEPDKYKSIVITNPAITFAQLLKEIISKITSEPCAENRKLHLLQKFHRLLFKTSEKGQKIVIFIDEADSISPANLDNLRLLTSMQDDQRNLFALVLAGQLELARRLEHPKRANLFQRIGIYGRINKLPSVEAVKKYIETRLRLAGTQKLIFTPESIQVIWDNSDEGIPRLINKICKVCLIEAAVGGMIQVTPELVLQVATRFQKLGGAAIQSRKPRCTPDDFDVSDVVEMTEEVIEMISTQAQTDNSTDDPNENKTVLPDEQPSGDSEPPLQEDSPISTTDAPADPEPPAILPPAQEADMPDEDREIVVQVAANGEAQAYEEISGKLEIQIDDSHEDESTEDGATSDIQPIEVRADLPTESQPQVDSSSSGTTTQTASPSNIQSHGEDTPSSDEKPLPAEDIGDDEIIIDGNAIRLDIPKEILARVKSFNRESALKSAGFWAAKILKKNPHLTNSPQADPVHIWNQIKDAILKRLSI